MYILLNRDLLTIPYKHSDPFVLCDMLIIEFPSDNVRVIPINESIHLDDLTDEELLVIYCNLGNSVTTVGRQDIIYGILNSINDADDSDLPKYNVMMQARAFEADRDTRHRFAPGAYLPDLRPVAEPNCSNIIKSSRQSLRRNDLQSSAVTVSTHGVSSTKPQISQTITPPWQKQVDVPASINDARSDLEVKIDAWYHTNFASNQDLDQIYFLTKFREYLTNQGVTPWSISEHLNNLKNRLQSC